MARTQRARCITTRGHQSFFLQRERIQVRSHLAVARRRFRDVPQSAGDSEGSFAEADERPRLDPFIFSPAHKSERPLIKVHFNVAYRCHSRQLLCMGGSQFPFGWSFVSIAKLPMTWNPRDRWTTEARHSVLTHNVKHGSPGLLADGYEVRVQVWTNQQDEDSEGVVEITYRSGKDANQPPDVQKIRKQMAIVDWQPGPNRIIQIPDEAEVNKLVPGERKKRMPARPRSYYSYRKLDHHPQKSTFQGTAEELYLDPTGEAVLYRQDIWPSRGTSLSFDEARRFFLGE